MWRTRAYGKLFGTKGYNVMISMLWCTKRQRPKTSGSTVTHTTVEHALQYGDKRYYVRLSSGKLQRYSTRSLAPALLSWAVPTSGKRFPSDPAGDGPEGYTTPTVPTSGKEFPSDISGDGPGCHPKDTNVLEAWTKVNVELHRHHKRVSRIFHVLKIIT